MTKEISVKINKFNPFKLDEDIRAVSGEYQGHKTGDGLMTLLFTENATQEEMDTAADIAFNHDPKVLTDFQQAEKDKRDEAAALQIELAKIKNDPMARALAILLGEKFGQ